VRANDDNSIRPLFPCSRHPNRLKFRAAVNSTLNVHSLTYVARGVGTRCSQRPVNIHGLRAEGSSAPSIHSAGKSENGSSAIAVGLFGRGLLTGGPPDHASGSLPRP